MPVLIRNNASGPAVFTTDDIEIVWGGAGQSGDVKAVPSALLENVDFITAINQGIFSQVDDEDVAQAELRAEAQAQAQQRAQKAQESLAKIDRNANRVIARVDIDEKDNRDYKSVDADELIDIPL